MPPAPCADGLRAYSAKKPQRPSHSRTTLQDNARILHGASIFALCDLEVPLRAAPPQYLLTIVAIRPDLPTGPAWEKSSHTSSSVTCKQQCGSPCGTREWPSHCATCPRLLGELPSLLLSLQCQLGHSTRKSLLQQGNPLLVVSIGCVFSRNDLNLCDLPRLWDCAIATRSLINARHSEKWHSLRRSPIS